MGGAMRVLLGSPRGFCAGVDRAVSIVESALERFGPPIYVRHEIVHNGHVLASLRERGVIFVDHLDDVPQRAIVIFSAHGVAPAVWREAEDRQLRVIDATCPLVKKVHLEVTKHARNRRTVLVIGHPEHVEVIGTVGHYEPRPGARIIVVENDDQARAVTIEDPDNVAYVTQTTLAADSTAGIIGVLKERFPHIVGPQADDICYATQNRQRVVAKLADLSDIVIILGARHSSNSVRMLEVALARSTPAYLVDCAREVKREWLTGMTTIGITSGASSPEYLVTDLLATLRAWYPDLREEAIGRPETVQFRMPRELEQTGVKQATR